jgi:hypothetical protein
LRREAQNAATAGVGLDRLTGNPQSGEGIAQKHFTANMFEGRKVVYSIRSSCDSNRSVRILGSEGKRVPAEGQSFVKA